MARSLGLPAVLGVAGLMPGVKTGDRVVVDGIAGRVFINPTPPRLPASSPGSRIWRASANR